MRFIPERHTAPYLSSEVTKIVQEWKLEKKVINATIDGASNINLAMQITTFLDKLRCITHTMNTVTKAILDKNRSIPVLDIVKKCRNLVCTFKHSNFLTDQLKKAMEMKRNAAQELLLNKQNDDIDLPPVRTLKQDVPTRWNSTYLMLKSVFEAHDSITTVINSNAETKKKYANMLLVDSKLEIVEDLVFLLLPFFQFTELMSGSK